MSTPFHATAQDSPIPTLAAVLPRVACIAVVAAILMTGIASPEGLERAYAETEFAASLPEEESETGADAVVSPLAAYSVPSSAQASGTCGGCTWFIRSASDASAPGQFVLYPTDGLNGTAQYSSLPPWYHKNGLIKSAYIAPGVKAGTTAYGFFEGADLMTHADVSNLDLSACKKLWSFFCDCEKLVEIDGLDRWNVATVDDFRQVFRDCVLLPQVDLSSWKVGQSAAENLAIDSMFEGCTNLQNIGNVSGWDLSSCASMDELFLKCKSLESVAGLETWDTGSVTTFYRVFYQTGIRNLDISSWKTSQALDMREILNSLNSGDVDSITVGAGFDFEPEGLPQGVWTGSNDPRVSLPTPAGKDSEGRALTGRWIADSNGASYAPNAIPSFVADTYRPEAISLGTLALAGNAVVGKTITALLEGSSGVAPAYSWEKSASTSGPWETIEGAVSASYTLQASDANAYLKCTVSDSSGKTAEKLSVVSSQVTMPQLTGSASISGSYVYKGGKLTASTEKTPENALLTYSWYTGDAQGSSQNLVGTGASYVLTAQDVGKFITCIVRDESGAYEGEIAAKGSMVTAVLSVSVPDKLQGTVSALGEIAWQEFGTAKSESSCPIRVASAKSSVPGQESAVCSLQNFILKPGETALISWTGLSTAHASVYEQAAMNPGAYISAGALTYVFEAA